MRKGKVVQVSFAVKHQDSDFSIDHGDGFTIVYRDKWLSSLGVRGRRMTKERVYFVSWVRSCSVPGVEKEGSE